MAVDFGSELTVACQASWTERAMRARSSTAHAS